jgi:hypothetical protein
MTTTDPTLDPRFIAGVQLLERTGAQTFRIGWSDEGDGPPIVYYAVAQWVGNRAEAAGALHPVAAVLRLCEKVIDGGACTHCHRLTIFVEDTDTELLDQMGCVYAWDPELETFRRSCEGDAP